MHDSMFMIILIDVESEPDEYITLTTTSNLQPGSISPMLKEPKNEI